MIFRIIICILLFQTFEIKAKSNNSGCKLEKDKKSIITPPPTISNQPQDKHVCAASPTTFSVIDIDGVSYSWEMRTNNSGTFSTLSDNSIYTNTQTSTLNISNCTGLNGLQFRVIISDASNNTTISDTATLFVYIIEKPDISCGNSSINSVEFNWSDLTGVSSYTVSYSINSTGFMTEAPSNIPSFSLSNLNPSDTVDIIVSTSGSTFCYANANAQCFVDDCFPPIITNQPTSNQSCKGEEVNLEILTDGVYSYSWEVSSDANFNFNAIPNDANYIGTSSNKLTILNNTNLNGSFYRAIIHEPYGLCPLISDTIALTVVQNPTINNPFSICQGETVQLSSSTEASTLTPWLNNNNNSITINNLGVVLAETEGINTITFTDINGCTTNTTITVFPDETPEITCKESTTKSVVFEWNAPLSSSSFDISYTVNNSYESNPFNQNINTYLVENLTVDDTVEITIQTNGSGCYTPSIGYCFTKSCTPSEALFSIEPNTIKSSNPINQFKNNSTNATSYFWDFGDGNSSNSPNPTHEFLIDSEIEDYDITLIAFNTDNCNDTTRKTLLIEQELIYYIPNSFSPNQDNLNNEFKPIFYSGHNPYSFKMIIMNRWGEVVFETNNLKSGWKGDFMNSGNLAQSGIYLWKINIKEKGTEKEVEIKGNVLLVR